MVISSPSNETISFTCGILPRRWITNPPTDSNSPFGSSKPRCSSSFSTSKRASTRSVSSSMIVTRDFSSSCSSMISPTISSIISSTVIIPAVPPYSSVTMARWVFLSFKSCNSSLIFCVPGTKQGFLRISSGIMESGSLPHSFKISFA